MPAGLFSVSSRTTKTLMDSRGGAPAAFMSIILFRSLVTVFGRLDLCDNAGQRLDASQEGVAVPTIDHDLTSNHSQSRRNAAAVACRICAAISFDAGVTIVAFGASQAAFESLVSGLSLVVFSAVLYFGHLTDTVEHPLL